MEAVMDRSVVEEITTRFQALVSIVPLSAIRTSKDYDKAVLMLNQLLDAGAADENSPLADLANSLGSLIGDYEDAHHAGPEISPVATLRFLMEQHRLTQSDLPEVGTQGVVSEILRGKRELNIRQIKVLSSRFHVPASVFI
ncbi:MAG: type II toxin-antitoxin system antitoxin HigA [Aquirhabdus sp.]